MQVNLNKLHSDLQQRLTPKPERFRKDHFLNREIHQRRQDAATIRVRQQLNNDTSPMEVHDWEKTLAKLEHYASGKADKLLTTFQRKFWEMTLKKTD